MGESQNSPRVPANLEFNIRFVGVPAKHAASRTTSFSLRLTLPADGISRSDFVVVLVDGSCVRVQSRSIHGHPVGNGQSRHDADVDSVDAVPAGINSDP